MLPVTPEVHAAESQAWQSAGRVAQFADYLERMAAAPAMRVIADRSLALMTLTPGARVLEVGCGTGVFLARLAEAVGPRGQVTGVDHAARLAEQARQRTRSLPSVRIDVATAYALPYPDGAFDIAHCERLLVHLDDPAAALSEMRRVVRPGGRVVVGEPAWSSLAIDHPDAEAIDLLTRQAIVAGRQPRMGLQLNRHLAGAGLVERTIEGLTLCCRDVAEFVAYGLDLPAAADALAAQGRLERGRAQGVLDDLVAASAAGTFFGFLGFFLARGERGTMTEATTD